MSQQIEKLIRQYAEAVRVKPDLIKKAFMKGDINQRKRDLIAMRATLYAKQHVKKEMTYEEQQKVMEGFMKTENFSGVIWPTFKIVPTLKVKKEEKVLLKSKN